MSEETELKNIILVGMMGSGKTTLGRSLALKLNMGFFDVDEWIERKARRSIAQIFLTEGEDKFRQWENQGLEFMQQIRNHVVAMGGGTIKSEADWPKISHLGRTIWVHTPISQVIGQIKKQERSLIHRPLLSDLADEKVVEVLEKKLTERLSTILGQRSSIYKLAELEFVPLEKSVRLNTMQLAKLLNGGSSES